MASKQEIQDASYRSQLTDQESKSYEDYDKALLALSTGAIGVSIAFIKNVLGDDPMKLPGLMIASWWVWTGSILFLLISFVTSQLAMRQASEEFDRGDSRESLGGNYDNWTNRLNYAGGLCFFVGVILTMVFVTVNFGG